MLCRIKAYRWIKKNCWRIRHNVFCIYGKITWFSYFFLYNTWNFSFCNIYIFRTEFFWIFFVFFFFRLWTYLFIWFSLFFFFLLLHYGCVVINIFLSRCFLLHVDAENGYPTNLHTVWNKTSLFFIIFAENSTQTNTQKKRGTQTENTTTQKELFFTRIFLLICNFFLFFRFNSTDRNKCGMLYS